MNHVDRKKSNYNCCYTACLTNYCITVYYISYQPPKSLVDNTLHTYG